MPGNTIFFRGTNRVMTPKIIIPPTDSEEDEEEDDEDSEDEEGDELLAQCAGLIDSIFKSMVMNFGALSLDNNLCTRIEYCLDHISENPDDPETIKMTKTMEKLIDLRVKLFGQEIPMLAPSNLASMLPKDK